VDAQFRNSDDVDKGIVIRQDPNAREFAPEGSTVTIEVSSGEETVTVPSNLIGLQLSQAKTALLAQGLERFNVERVESSEARNVVLSVDPGSGNEVALDTRITITVSAGPVTVPDVVGFRQDNAVQTLESEDFEVYVDDEFSEVVAEGRVIEQNPAADTEASSGDLVTIVVSLGPEETETTPPPSDSPTTEEPTDTPTTEPTEEPTEEPSEEPTEQPTDDELPDDEPPGNGPPSTDPPGNGSPGNGSGGGPNSSGNGSGGGPNPPGNGSGGGPIPPETAQLGTDLPAARGEPGAGPGRA
jgi:serine/threonine-protein kinase